MAIRIADVDVINDDRELVLAKLTDINETINDTAVDVFVYDTSKDSDGGAWRHRTQHTSWYAEASSASRDVNTRSTRAEFPAVAVIVAESDKVTIYDGDDPSLPMWMVFNAGGSGSSWNFLINGNVNGCFFKNGKLCLSSSNNALIEISFIDEEVKQRYSLGMFFWLSGIVSRNSSSLRLGGADAANAIVNSTVNDVAMTVLPDAPTDPATGLEIPTIAVATNDGVSVIKDDGTVVDSSRTDTIFSVVFLNDGSVAFSNSNFANDRVWISNGPPQADGFSIVEYDHTSSPYIVANNPYLSYGDELYIGSQSGANGLYWLDHDYAAKEESMVANATSSYNTGWMPGDIKLAALADTTAETFGDAVSGATVSDPNLDGVYDGEHVTNGGFATGDLTGWTDDSSGGWAYDAGRAYHALSSDFQTLRQSLDLTAGNTYVVSFDYEVVSGELRCQGRTAANLPDPAFVINNITGTGSRSETFVATAGLDSIAFARDNSGISSEFYIDNISVRLADPDRSVNGKGLAVHGSITKAPVATGADLVAYSGFNSSNYLEQPYNSDLDFGAYNPEVEGSGDFCYSWWMNAAAISSYDGVISRGQNKLEITYGADETLSVRVGSDTQIISSVLPTNTWNHFAVTRVDGVVSTYINGSLDNSNSVDGTNSVDTTDPLLVGTSVRDLTRGLDGSLALLRISGTAPTADQIRKIYEDEKVLFQEDAKATLTGSSDAVTALAYDHDTNLLHVGTSGGRSVFQGLRRVEEHTGTNSQSLAAISAVDGLVVEGK